MYLALRFQNAFFTPIRVLYCVLFTFIVSLYLNPALQSALDAWLLSHVEAVLFVKISFLLSIGVAGYKRLAVTVAVLATLLNIMGVSLAASTSCMFIVGTLLLFILLSEIAKLIALDRYYQNKHHYDLFGIFTSVGMVLALV